MLDHDMHRAPVIVDTDAGPDDLMALGYLLAHDEIKIEALTAAYGLAHTARGGINLARVVAASGSGHIPVYIGRDRPLQYTAAFPERWRELSDRLPGVGLPVAYVPPESESAESFLKRRLRRASNPVRILALGALTNLAGLTRATAPAVQEIISMGGAFEVPGNVIDSGDFVSPTKTAEWNYFADPLATHHVLTSDIPVTIVPLDATNHVPVTTNFIDQFIQMARSPVGRLTAEVFEIIRPYAEMGRYFAWDPLAAVYLANPEVLHLERSAISVTLSWPDAGTTRRASSGIEKQIAIAADAACFSACFSKPFAEQARAYT